ncbi:hypothetical protein OROGR_028100 [Orobanche gracilis]
MPQFDSSETSSEDFISFEAQILEGNNSHANDTSTPTTMSLRNRKRNLTSEQKRAVYEMLLKDCTDGSLAKGVISKAAKLFSISIRPVSRIWHTQKYFSSIREDHRQLFFFRSCEEGWPKESPSRLATRKSKKGSIRAHTNAIKPYLTDDNKKIRLKFCLSMIDEGTLQSKPAFVNMHDQIHIDESGLLCLKLPCGFISFWVKPNPIVHAKAH